MPNSWDDDNDGTDDTPAPGLSLDVGAQLHLDLCSLTDAVNAQRDDEARREQERLSRLPIPLRGVLQQTIGAGKYAVYDFGTPASGRWWAPRIVVTAVDGAEFGTTGAFTANWYAGTPPTGGTALNMPVTSMLFATQTAIAAAATGGAQVAGIPTAPSVYVRSGEHLFAVVLNSMATTQNIDCLVYFDDEPVKRARVVTQA